MIDVAVGAPHLGATEHVTALFESECERLLGFFVRRVELREDAADLVAETALTLWRRAGDVPLDPEQARMWLYGVARRVLSTHRRGGARRSALADRLRDELAVEPPPHPHEGTVEWVRAAVESLPPRDRELVTLVHWDGFSLAQAATILRLRDGTARMRYRRARIRLRALLSE